MSFTPNIEDLLHNWALWVRWGDSGRPLLPVTCASFERMYASHNSRFQYEGRPPRPPEPRQDDGAHIERIICDPDFPAVWRRVLKVEYTTYRRDTEDSELFLQRKAHLARVNSRTYWDYLDSARAFIYVRYVEHITEKYARERRSNPSGV